MLAIDSHIGLSHELRTPLTSISGFASTLSDKWDSLTEADKKHFVQIIQQQAKHMSIVIDQVLVDRQAD